MAFGTKQNMEPGVVYRIRLSPEMVKSTRLPERLIVVVPPKWRDHSLQKTVVRYDKETGKYFVDEYLERMSPALVSSKLKDGYRPVRSIVCPAFQFQVALTACSSYCEEPCDTHMRELSKKGVDNLGRSYAGWYYRRDKQTDAALIPSGMLNRARRASRDDEE